MQRGSREHCDYSRNMQGSGLLTERRRTLVPLNRMCSKKCATPLFASVSKRLPELIQIPTVVVSAKGIASVATRRPFRRVVT